MVCGICLLSISPGGGLGVLIPCMKGRLDVARCLGWDDRREDVTTPSKIT